MSRRAGEPDQADVGTFGPGGGASAALTTQVMAASSPLGSPSGSTPGVDRNGLQVLSRAECIDLLGKTNIGRVGVTSQALPLVLPVSYAMLAEDIVFATTAGSKALAITDRTVIAFEVDNIDLETRSGWSVLAVGLARPFSEGDIDLPAARQLKIDPWAAGATLLIRMPTERLSGRRVESTTAPAGRTV